MNQPKLTAEQSAALLQSNGRPVYLLDEVGNETSVVLVRVELLKTLVGEEFDIADTYPAQDSALAAVWGDPKLDEYSDQDGSPVD